MKIVALSAYLSPFSNTIVLFIKSVNLYFENVTKRLNVSGPGESVRPVLAPTHRGVRAPPTAPLRDVLRGG